MEKERGREGEGGREKGERVREHPTTEAQNKKIKV